MQYAQEVPAYLRDPSILEGQEAFTGGIGGQRGPHITVTNGRFLLVDTAGEQKPVASFDPQRGVYLDIVVIDANPGLAKTYYESKYVQGSKTPPDCSSSDGIEPDASILEPQSLTCHGCPKNIFGSAITDAGKQAKACSDKKRLAVMYVYDFEGPLYEFAVSPSNLRLWNEHVQNLAGRGIPLRGVVTRVFADTTRTGGLLFEAAPDPGGAGLWFVPQNYMAIVNTARQSEECRKAIGVTGQSRLALAAPQAQPQISYTATAAAPIQHTVTVAAPLPPVSYQQPAPVQPAAFGATAVPSTLAPTGFGGAAPVVHPTTGAGSADSEEGTARRPRRTKAQMEADRREKEAQSQAVSSAQSFSAAPLAVFGSDPSNGNQGTAGFAAPATTAFGGGNSGPAPQINNAFGGPAGIRMPEQQVQQPAAFGVVTNVPAASAEVDAMLASVMGSPQ